MDTRGKIVLIITTFLVGVPAATSASAAEPDDIVNYRGYSDRLASSGQPTRSQFPGLKEAGFERVVFLAFTDHDESVPHEDRIVSRLGMDYVQIPVDWEEPARSDFYAFAGVMRQEPPKKTLVHCQVNFRASSFSFLYRVLYEDVDIGQAKDDLDSVWVPNDTWRQFIFDILEENGRSPHCDACLWSGG
jgi:protein tyrosine phosphatase (PTP) superfamily phosphohydrolase (DUF442 family)